MSGFSHKILMSFYGCKVLHQFAPSIILNFRTIVEQTINLKLIGENYLRAVDWTCSIRSGHY